MAENTESQNSASATDRAQSTLENWGRQAGRFLAAAAARTREEAEDIWAEAQSIRKGERK